MNLFFSTLELLSLIMLSATTLPDDEPKTESAVQVVVLGVAQDAGYPQANCKKHCCELAWRDFSERKHVSCIAVVDNRNQKRFLFDCTPNFPDQLQLLDSRTNFKTKEFLDGIFLTHGHIGHYTGLMYLGRESIGANDLQVYGTPRMNQFLSTNGPWSQLVKLSNIKLNGIELDSPLRLTDQISVVPFQVPHRDEFTDTLGFKIIGPDKTLVYLPDIDKWSKWTRSIEKLLVDCDFALLDGTFMSEGELPGRNMSAIPHPFIDESISRFSSMEKAVRKRIKFIHLNHTNPAIRLDGDPKRNPAARRIYESGMGLAHQGEIIRLDDQ